MSDPVQVPPDEQGLPADPNYPLGGVIPTNPFTGMKLSPDVIKYGTLPSATPVNAQQARNILTQRIIELVHKSGGPALPSDALTVADKIVEFLPDDAMYSTTVMSLDLRPFAAVLAKVPAGAYWDPGYAQQIINGTDTMMAENIGVVVGDQLGGKQTQADAREAWKKYDTETVGVTPERLFGQGVQDAQAAADAGADPNTVQDQVLTPDDPMSIDLTADPTAAPITFPEEDFRTMLRTGYYSDLQALISAESQWTAKTQQPGGVMTNFGTKGGPDLPGVPRVQTKVLNTVDALDYIHTLNETEVERMQQALAAGGYYEGIQGLTKYDKGNAFDDATEIAWQRALTDSVKQGVAVPDLLKQKAVSYRDEQLKQFAAFSTTSTRQAANRIAVDAIGRELTADEYGQMRTYLMSLRDQRAQAVPGVDDMSWQNTETATTGYSQDEIASKVQDIVDPEVASSNSWNAGQKLFQFMGVDFPGTQRKEK